MSREFTDDEKQAICAIDNWYALNFKKAKPQLERVMVGYLGVFPLLSGRRPQTDGKRIFLPSQKSDFKDSKRDLFNNRNMSLYRSDLVHEILHILEGSFFVDGREYLKSFENEGLAHSLYNITDDARIEYNGQFYLQRQDVNLLVGSNQFYSSKNKLSATVHERFMDIFSTQIICKGLPSMFNPAVKDVERETLEFKVDNDQLNKIGVRIAADVLERAMMITNNIYGPRHDRRSVEVVWSDVPELYELVTKAFPKIEQEFPNENSRYAPVNAPASDKDSKGKGESEGEGQGQGTGASDEGAKDKTQKVYVGFRGDVHDFSAADTAESTLGKLAGNFSKKSPFVNSASGVGMSKAGSIKEDVQDKKDPNKVQIITYNDLKKSYMFIASLQYQTYEGRNDQFVTELAKYSHLREQIVGHFAKLRPNAMQRVRFQEDPDQLNMEAVIEVLSDPNLAANARIYDSQKIIRRDTLNVILIDISGSTGNQLADGKRVIDVEKEAAGLLYQALTHPAVGDRVLLYAFSTDTEKTNLYRIDSLENLGALETEGGNADGVAIRGVAAELNKMVAKEKNLFVFTDGKPVAAGYDAGDPVIDTSMAFGEVEALGIRTFYFNVDNDPSDYFDILTKNTTFSQNVPSVLRLPQAVCDLVYSVL